MHIKFKDTIKTISIAVMQVKRNLPMSKKTAIRLRKQGFFETGLEKKMKKTLKSLEINFKQEEYFPGVGMVDFYLPDFALVIECDGEHWHETPEAIAHDQARDKTLKEKYNIRVLRFTGNAIIKHIDDCINIIKGATNGT
jgi:very-short-patch-repair endonuclease